MMKSPLSKENTLPGWQLELTRKQPDQSLFSLLLEIESKLRAEARGDSLVQAGERKLAKSKSCQRSENLSRYIE